MKIYFIVLFSIVWGNIDASEMEDRVFFYKICDKLVSKKMLPLNEFFAEVGNCFLGVPYVGGTLESDGDEELVVNLSQVDCTTFVEYSLAIALEIKNEENPSYEGFKGRLQNMRYRGGILEDYASRLHYVTEWIVDNNDLFRNITTELGGDTISKDINFMTSHIQSYPTLEKSADLVQKMIAIEENINESEEYIVLPKILLDKRINALRTGDIVVFATDILGLDYSHIGIVVNNDTSVKLLHASSRYKKVLVDPKALLDYCGSSAKCIGITILRLHEN